MKFKKLLIFICVFLSIQISTAQYAEAANINGKYISSKGASVIDFETGEILYEHNGDTPMLHASMTKVMTVYCVYDAIRDGKISMSSTVPVSSKARSISIDPSYMGVPLEYNTKYTVEEMLNILLIYSACAPAVALAELVSGSEAAFVNKMNTTASKMGLNAVYYDCIGVANNRISANSMVRLARNLIKDFPQVISITSKTTVNFHGYTRYTSNKLLTTYYYSGADGLKTGTTSGAGYCFCGTAVKNGRRIIAVTLGSDSTSQRFRDVSTMLDYGFNETANRKPTINFSDMKTFINGYEIPTFAHSKTANTHPIILADDMAAYGFDLSYDYAASTLTLTYNPSKPVNPIPLQDYKGKTGMKAFDITPANTVKVAINDGYCLREINEVYNINGYMAISADELKGIYDYSWVNSSRTAHISTLEIKFLPIYDIYEKCIYFTDSSTFINGNEVPTFTYKGKNAPGAYIIAENLQNYGFNVKYDENSRTLFLSYNPQKNLSPMETEHYKNKNNTKAFDVVKSDIRVLIDNGQTVYTAVNPLNINGYMCIPVKELANIGSLELSSSALSAYIYIQ